MGESAADVFGSIYNTALAHGFEVPTQPTVVEATGPSADFFDGLRTSMAAQGAELPYAVIPPRVLDLSSLALHAY